MEQAIGLKILLVEDHDDIREALTAILEGEGYDIVAVGSAEAAVGRLLEDRFHLVVTDYCLPVKTGTWMVEEARSRGALGDAKVLMITAHPAPRTADDVQVMRKPLDVDDFLDAVAGLLAPQREAALGRLRAAMSAPGDAAAGAAGNGRVTGAAAGTLEGPKVELVLYVSSGSHSSVRALRNLRKLLSAYDGAQVRLTVHDLSQGVVPDAEADRIAFTPTLVRRHPGPRAWILGDLERPEVVADLLSMAGVQEKR